MNAPTPATARKLAALAIVTTAALGLAACGGSDDTSTAAETTPTTDTSAENTSTAANGATVSFEADPSGALQFTETEVTAKAGNDTIDFNNPSSTGHDVVIEDESGNQVAQTDIITGSTTSTTADLKSGTYTFFCSVPGHREAGMEGTLTVK